MYKYGMTLDALQVLLAMVTIIICSDLICLRLQLFLGHRPY